MFTFIGSNMTNSRKDIRAMCSTSLNAITMIDSSLTSFVVNVKITKLVIEVNWTGTQITTQQCCVSGKYRSDIDFTLFDQWNCNACEPFVKMSNDSWTRLGLSGLLIVLEQINKYVYTASHDLNVNEDILYLFSNFTNKPSYQVTK